MKRFNWSALLTALGFAACQSGTRENHVPELLPIPHEVHNIIAGTWYQSDYIEELAITRSPTQTKKGLGPYVELTIPPTGELDTATTAAGNNNHEIEEFTIFFRPGLGPNTLRTEIPGEIGSRYELAYRITDKDTAIELILYDQTNKVVESRKYRRGPRGETEPFNLMVNISALAGLYDRFDSSGNKSLVEFRENGKIRGLPGCRDYQVITDFVADPGLEFDEVCFNLTKPDQLCLSFRFHGDTLRLCELIEDESNETVKTGAQRFELVRHSTSPGLRLRSAKP